MKLSSCFWKCLAAALSLSALPLHSARADEPQPAPLLPPPPSPPNAAPPLPTAPPPTTTPPAWNYPPPLPPYMLVPPTLPYNESEPIPPGYHLETKKNKALIISGLSLFGLAYAISLGTSLIILSSGSNDAGQFAPLLIPVAGPFITMGTVKGGQTIFLVDGITQTVGAVLLGIGIFKENPLLVRDDIKLSSAKPQVFIGPSSATLRWRF